MHAQWFGTAANMRKISPDVSSIRVGSIVVTSTTVVRNLGVMLDAELSNVDSWARVPDSAVMLLPPAQTAFCPSATCRDVTARLAYAFVLSRLDYCNVVLAGLPTSTLAPLQRVLHAAARLPRPRITGSPGIALATDRQEDRLQAVPVGSQSVDRADAAVHRRHVDTCLQCPVTEHPALYSGHANDRRPQSQCDAGCRAVECRCASDSDYIVPRTHRKLGERASTVAAPKAWNQLPTKLKTSTCSTDSFKRSLRTFLFESAYGCETRVSWLLQCAIGQTVGGAIEITVCICICI